MNATSANRGTGGRPLISVITPTKNRRELLCETMDSVQRQTLSQWEHLIVDDGSTDGTAEEVQARAKSDPRIRFIQRAGDRAGANVCRNIGMANGRAELLVFLDSDDLLRPDCLQRRVETMRRNRDLDFVVFGAGVFVDEVDDLGRLYHPLDPGDDLLRFLSHECLWQTTGPVWRKSFLERIGGFDEALLSMQDLELHVRALCAHGRYVCFRHVDHDIRGRADSSRTSMQFFSDPRHFEATDDLRAKLLAIVRSAGLLTWSRRRALLGFCFRTAELWARSGAFKQALGVWERGCRQLEAPLALRLSGLLMLVLSTRPGQMVPWRDRVVNRWKGSARFRQEPALLRHEAASTAEVTFVQAQEQAGAS